MENIEIKGMTAEQLVELFTKGLAGSLDKFFKESGMNDADKRYLVHPGVKNEGEHLRKSQAERLHSLLCALKQKDYAKINTKAADPLSEGVDSDGGYLVPEEVRNEIMRLVPTFGQARGLMREMPMGKADTLVLPMGVNGVKVNWVNEKSKIGQSKPTFAIDKIVAQKAAAIVPIANELLQDANVLIGQYILELIAEAMGTEEDAQFFNGTGAPFKGIFNGDHTFGFEKAVALAALGYEDLLDMVYGVDSKILGQASWKMHRTLMPKIRTIKDDNGNLVFTPANGSTPALLLGYPVQLIEAAPTAQDATTELSKPYLLLGNTKNSFIGTKPEVAVKISEDATIDGTSLYEYDLSAIRAIERVGFNAGLTKAYSVISTPAV